MWEKFVIFGVSSILFCLLLDFTGSSDSTALTEYFESTAVQDDYFVVVDEWRENGLKYSIVYASDTKVMYLMADGPYRFGITELYNGDGSIRLYE